MLVLPARWRCFRWWRGVISRQGMRAWKEIEHSEVVLGGEVDR